MTNFNSLYYVTRSRQAERSLQFAMLLLLVWGGSWLITWFAIERLTVNGPIIPVLFARNAICFGLGVKTIALGAQALRYLKKHLGYSTGYLRAMIGITVGLAFVIVEMVTFSLTVLLMIEKGRML